MKKSRYLNKVRNFCIVAHIDHGKTTLSDCLLEISGSVEKRKMKNQLLDSMDLEKERGITIKLHAVQMHYKDYVFNLIDTPGHVDFSYEVSRSLSACEGALLIVDATQGIQAQTLSNAYLALANDLFIVPIINKIDLPSANVADTKQQIQKLLGITHKIPCISAKNKINIQEVFDAIVNDIPAPDNYEKQPLKMLIFDSYYDDFQGIVVFGRVKTGSLRVGNKIKFMASDKEYVVLKIGVKTPEMIQTNELKCGGVGWFTAGIKDIHDVQVGETVTLADNPAQLPLPGFRPVIPMVYCGIYPVESNLYPVLKDAFGKLNLTDSSLEINPESSQALGSGFRCGFLGLLHLEIVMERLRREYGVTIIPTIPSVIYKVNLTNKKVIEVSNPSEMPDATKISFVEEPLVRAKIMTPNDYLGRIMDFCHSKYGKYESLEVIDDEMREVIFEIPLAEIIYDFFDNLKSLSRGYASLDYEFIGYQKSPIIKVDLLIHHKVVDALSFISHKDEAASRGRAICKKLKNVISRHQFEIAIQAAVGKKILARETVSAFRKDVIAKCYGGDISRKRKLLENQKKGKKNMKMIGSVEVPQEAFVKILEVDK